jgi:predicted phosphodiesterase
MGKLYAIGDIHLGHPFNTEAWKVLDDHPDDGLILCGDVGESAAHLELAFGAATRKFRQVWWCPGNHELYTMALKTTLRGEDKYAECVEIARRHGVRTPEDDFVEWRSVSGSGSGSGSEENVALVAPIFTLYDYTFCPEGMDKEAALQWASEADTVATDEFLLHPDPFPTREDWCNALVAKAERKLEEANSRGIPLIIVSATAMPLLHSAVCSPRTNKVNHWPLREDLVHIPRVPRFKLWCGTKKTEDWHKRFDNTKVVISGHLHVPRTDWKDGVRFEECSLGYPKQWELPRNNGLNINDLLREILPGPPAPASGTAGPEWRRYG